MCFDNETKGKEMSQLKAFKFYKALSSFSINLISAFVPLIIYQSTDNNIYLALLFVACQKILTLVFKAILKPHIEAAPEIFLILRTIPIILFQICMVFIDYNLLVFSILMCILNALNFTMKEHPSDCLQNYSSSSSSFSSSSGIVRLLEYASYALSAVLGGLFLDYLPDFVLVILSLSLYLISILPMFIIYIKNRKNKAFNKDMISTATASLNAKNATVTTQLQKSIIRKYFVSYYLISIYDTVCELLPLYFFIKFGNFSTAGYLSGLQNFAFGVGNYITSLLYAKHDLRYYNVISAILSAAFCAIMPFVSQIAMLFVVYGLFQFFYGSSSIYIYNKMSEKSRILGILNNSLYSKNSATYWAYITGPLFCMALGGAIAPVCFLGAGASVLFGIYHPIMEEHARRQMVDYLQENDIKLSKRIKATHTPKAEKKSVQAPQHRSKHSQYYRKSVKSIRRIKKSTTDTNKDTQNTLEKTKSSDTTKLVTDETKDIATKTKEKSVDTNTASTPKDTKTKATNDSGNKNK